MDLPPRRCLRHLADRVLLSFPTLSFTFQELSPHEPHVFGLLQPMTSPTLKQTLGLFPRSKGNWEGIYSFIHPSNHSFTHSISVTSMLSTPWCQSQG